MLVFFKMGLLQELLWFLDIRTVLLCVFLLLFLRWLLGQPKNLPPGPWGFPVVGSLPAIIRELRRGSEPHHLFARFAAQYGPVFRLKVLHKTLVVLNDYSSVKEAFQHPQLSDRQALIVAEAAKSIGVGSASGELSVDLRRFCLGVFKSFGVGKSSFEERIGVEAEELLKEMAAFDGKPFDPKHLLANAVSNVISSVMFGQRYEYTDLEFHKLLYYLRRIMKLLGSGGAIFFFPALRHLPFFSNKELMLNFEQLRKFLFDIIESHRATFDATNLRDFTDAYLSEIQQNVKTDAVGVLTNGKAKLKRQFGEPNMIGTILDMFIAGTETSSTTLQWCLLYMMAYPDIQQRVQAEIDAVVGRNRLPRLADKPQLNFTQAVIWEAQRLGNLVPLGIAHTAASDTQFRGYVIPKGTILIPNFWSVFQDPSVWSEPEKFIPERFLNGEGEAVKPDELIPFSVGRRSCIGEHLAKMELFIFFSYFMHQFTFKKPDDSPPLTLKGVCGLTNTPSTFDICAVKRD